MAGDVATGFTAKIAKAAILLLIGSTVGCGMTDECIQHTHMDTNGDIYYTFEGESCDEVVYPPQEK